MKGGQGLPKVSLGPAMPDPFMPYRRATPETVVPGVAHLGERPVPVFYSFGYPTPHAYVLLQPVLMQAVLHLPVHPSK
jgi:hypothetical protein